MSRWAMLAACGLLWAGHARGQELFPFVLPWDDASPGAPDLSGWLHRPAGKFGPVRAGTDGHLYAGDRRVRFFGVNVCFDACFPRHEEADKVAPRLAKFGVNVVRFHHTDMNPFPQGIRARGAHGTGDLDPVALDRLDYFVNRLKEHGIYTNLNLLISRPFNQADGLPADIETVGWKERHVVGFFDTKARALQQDYARKLLTHRNRYTGLTYAEDPAVAFVEINNENGLMHAWLGSEVDRLPEVFRRELRQQWNAWLQRRYGTDAKLRQAWEGAEDPLGDELLANGTFAQGVERWVLERHGQAEATAAPSDELPKALLGNDNRARSVRITVTRAGAEPWHVQFNQPGVTVQAGRLYTLTFWAKADRPLKGRVHVGQAHAPWQELGLARQVDLTTRWQPYRFAFRPSAADDNARVSFTDLARQPATVWLTGVSFRPGGVLGTGRDERLEAGTVELFRRNRFAERSAEAQRDWLRFLWETEDAYWQAMRHTLRDELKVRGLLIGTIVGCSTPNLMTRFDVVDTHAYWQHPDFPGRPWDPDKWVVRNRTMVNEVGGTLPDLALRRVAGKPFSVTEYNHSAPNTYGSEGFLLLAAYGALQDWDAVYAFAYSHRGDWNVRRIPSFFDIDQHPTKMVTLPAAVGLFVRGDVRPGEKAVVAGLDTEREVDALRTSWAWRLVDAGHAGVPREAALVHRVAVAVDGGKTAGPFAKPAGLPYVSDTGELTWDVSKKDRGVVTVNTPRSKAVIGYGGGRRFDLGGVIIEPGQSMQDGWSAVTLTMIEGDRPAGRGRLLVTATGLAENTGMQWKSPAHESVGRNWGQAPSVVEGVPVRVTLPRKATDVQAWALDERGQRRARLPVQAGAGGQATLALGPDWRTLWYEVEMK
jgi:Carbohydrate binding domain